MSIFTKSPRENRHYGLVALIGFVGGLFAAMIKSGCEDLLPPRLPSAIPPPIGLLQELGFSPDSMIYHFSDQVVNWGGNGVHYLFSAVIGLIYCCLVETYPKIRIGYGIIFGYIVAVIGFHSIILPILGLNPPIWDWSVDSLISELVGTPVWIFLIELFRHDFRYRVTGHPIP